MTPFVTVVAGDPVVRSEIRPWRWLDLGHIEGRMRKFASRSFRAKAEQKERTEDAASMPILAIWTITAKSSVIQRTVLDLALWVNVSERAFPVAACQIF